MNVGHNEPKLPMENQNTLMEVYTSGRVGNFTHPSEGQIGYKINTHIPLSLLFSILCSRP